MRKKAILLVNLGTPDDTKPSSIRRYLRQFLNDPRVVDLPSFIRWPLVNLLIIPFRFRKTRHAYRQIWTDAGSPLLLIGEQLRAALASLLGADYQVELGMRYGNPSIASAVDKLSNCDEVSILPLFPQYSSAATGSAVEEVMNVIRQQRNIPTVKIVRDFYNHAGFVNAFANKIREGIANKKIDKIIFSYHGLPEHHLTRSGCQATCSHQAACPVISEKNAFCYRAQCFATTRELVNQLGLQSSQFTVAFQSRLGKTPWIKPYTDLLLPELIQQGIKDIAIVCPSFVADCLETLEEINIRAREQWISLGGHSFTYIPCVNDSTEWVEAVAQLVK